MWLGDRLKVNCLPNRGVCNSEMQPWVPCFGLLMSHVVRTVAVYSLFFFLTCSSVATEWIVGKSIEQCLEIKNTDIATHLKLPPVKLHCSMLAEDAVKGAVKDYIKKNAEQAAAKATVSASMA